MIEPKSDTSRWHPEVRAAHSAATVRMKQATRRHVELFELVNAWRREDPISWESGVDNDRLGWFLRATANAPAPLEEASIVFNEVIHHLRTALNIALQEVARRNEFPVRLDLLQYPLALSEKEYKNQEKRLKGLPKYIKQAIQWRQPYFLAAENPVGHPLAVLGALDNDSKHRTNLQAKLGIESLESSLAPIYADAAPPPAQRKISYDFDFRDSWEMIREDTTPRAITDISGALDLVVDVAFEDRTGQLVTATTFAQQAFEEVSDSIGFLLAPWDDRLMNPTSIFKPPAGSSFKRR